MKKYLLLLLPVLFFFTACNKDKVSRISDKNRAAVVDSLDKLDSIVMMYRTGESEKGAEALKTARKIVARYPEDIEIKIKMMMLAGNFFYKSSPDSAFYFLLKCQKITDSLKIQGFTNNILHNLGTMYLQAKDYRQTVIFLDSALRNSIRTSDYKSAMICLNSLGNFYDNIQDKVTAKYYFDSAYAEASRIRNYAEMGIAYGNLARYESGNKKLRMCREAIQMIMKSREREPVAQALINLGLELEDPDSALACYKQALEFSGADLEIQIAAFNGMIYSYLDKKDIKTAEEVALKGIQAAEKYGDFEWYSEIYDSYSDVLLEKGDFAGAAKMEKISVKKYQDGNKQSSAAQVRLLAAILDVKNKENKIRQGEVLLKKERTTKNRILFGGLFLFGLAGTGVFMWNQKKKIRNQQQMILSAKKIIEAEESEKSKLARDFHDLTGQRFLALYSYCEQLDVSEDHQKDTVLEMISEIKGVVREMSHKLSPKWLEKFSLQESVRGLCSDCRKISPINLSVIIHDDIPPVSNEIKLHVFRIIQELLTNCMKYAGDAKVLVSILGNRERLDVIYVDDGPGFETAGKAYGMGIMNIFERTKLLGGEVELSSAPGSGTQYKIRIPLV